jgi:hypothetical protein
MEGAMKFVTFLMTGVALLCGTAAEAAQVRFHGSLTILEHNAVCEAEGVGGTGGFFVVRFRPPVVPDNGPGTSLSIFDQKNAFSFLLPEGRLTKRFKTVESMDIGDNFKPWEPPVKVRFTSNPEITAATDFITVNGQISGFEVPGCVVTFTMALTRRPD